MNTKKKKRQALEIAIILTVAAGKGGANNAAPTILSESYHAALALLDEPEKKKRKALKIAISLAVAAGKGGANNAVPTILSESYYAALAILNASDRDQDDDTPAQQDRKTQGKEKSR